MNRRQLMGQLLFASPAAVLPLSGRAEARRGVLSIPPGYAAVAQACGVPPAVLFCVACEESVMLFGARSLPYPWTLGVRGAGLRFGNYADAVRKLRELLDAGQRNIDCCVMQVNWGYHHRRLGSPERAMDPYPNLQLGASLLREHFEVGGDWPRAIAQYHQPGQTPRAQAYAARVIARIERMDAQARASLHV